MNSTIQEIFKKLNVKSFYITRLNEEEECVVFTHIQSPGYFSDNAMECIEYTVLLNFYCKNGLESKKNKILKAMLENGFKLIQIQTSILEKNGVFNTPFKFKKMEELK